MFRIACATLAFIALANPALAAGGCVTSADAAALKTAVINQELMVAAFQCREIGAYNRFVTTYRSELQSSDAVLKAYFVRSKHGEAGYDSFKTKAANLSALEQARHSDAFCANAHALFTAAFAHQGSLMSFVESRAADIGNICAESRPAAPALARADARKPAQVAAMSVPAHGFPAMPYRRDTAPAAPVAESMQGDNLAYADEDLPLPPRSRFYDIRSRDYAPPRSYGWYPRDGR